MRRTFHIACLALAVVLALPRPAPAARPFAWEPLTVLCIDRMVHFGRLGGVDESDADLALLRAGVPVLKRLEEAGPGGLLQWGESIPYLEAPILSTEADAILEGIINRLPNDRFTRLPWQLIQQRPRRRILAELTRYRNIFGVRTGESLRDPDTVERMAKEILHDVRHAADPTMEISLLARLARLGEASGIRALEKAVRWLRATVAAMETIGHTRLLAGAHAALGRVYLRLLAEARGPDAGDALGLLHYASGGDARDFLWDVEAVRSGRAPFAIWLARAVEMSSPEGTTRSHILARARTLEMELGTYDGRIFPREITSELLRYGLEGRPPRLPDGTELTRRYRDIEVRTLLLLAAATTDFRSANDEAMQALDNATLLVGDPRMDAGSLLLWVQSLFGERSKFSDVQFVRFLQEANTVLTEVGRVAADRRVVISREHRLRNDEDLGPSFDIWVTDPGGEVVEAIEIKQTDRPRRGSDIGGILRQATGKLDGALVPPERADESEVELRYRFAPDTPATLRHLLARKVLVIQMPWPGVASRYTRSGLTFVQRPDGIIERWRGDPGAGRLLGTEDLFREIARHFPRVGGTDVFDEIRITDLSGQAIVTYFHDRDTAAPTSDELVTEGNWRILRAPRRIELPSGP